MRCPTAHEITGHSDIECSADAACHDVDPIGALVPNHLLILSCRGRQSETHMTALVARTIWRRLPDVVIPGAPRGGSGNPSAAESVAELDPLPPYWVLGSRYARPRMTALVA